MEVVSVRSVVVAHRETLAAEGIAVALARYPALAPVGVATSAAETERRAEKADAVAIDARIPGAQGAVGRMRKRGLRVVVMGGPAREEDGEGGVVVCVRILRRAPRGCAGSRRAPDGVRGGRLSAREEQVLRLAAKGMACKQIARVLGISPKTVEQHKTRAFRRLGVPNQAAAVALLTEGGPGMEPIHYLKALRRRWWVIALSVVVAGSAPPWSRRGRGHAGSGSFYVAPSTGYTATKVLWDPGAPIIGRRSPITNPTTLAQFVKSPNVAAIAAQIMDYQGDPAAVELPGGGDDRSRDGLPGDHRQRGGSEVSGNGRERVLDRG